MSPKHLPKLNKILEAFQGTHGSVSNSFLAKNLTEQSRYLTCGSRDKYLHIYGGVPSLTCMNQIGA